MSAQSRRAALFGFAAAAASFASVAPAQAKKGQALPFYATRPRPVLPIEKDCKGDMMKPCAKGAGIKVQNAKYGGAQAKK